MPRRRSTDFESDPTTVLGAGYRLTKRFGLWALIACGLLYFIVVEQRSALQAIRFEHAGMMKTLGAICLNGAETPLEIERCRVSGAIEIPHANFYR